MVDTIEKNTNLNIDLKEKLEEIDGELVNQSISITNLRGSNNEYEGIIK
jgi:hypothetical protein